MSSNYALGMEEGRENLALSKPRESRCNQHKCYPLTYSQLSHNELVPSNMKCLLFVVDKVFGVWVNGYMWSL